MAAPVTYTKEVYESFKVSFGFTGLDSWFLYDLPDTEFHHNEQLLFSVVSV